MKSVPSDRKSLAPDRNCDLSADRIREVGRELFRRVASHRPWPLSPAWWDDRGMAWSMGDPQLKAALFRFVDALPNLASTQSVVDHVAAYLGPVRQQLPAVIRPWLGVAAWPVGPLVAGAAHVGTLRLAHRFIAGDTPRSAEPRLRHLRQQRCAFTLDVLGEAVLTEHEADQYAATYTDIFAHLGPAVATWSDDDVLDRDASRPIPRLNCSVKLSALTSHFDPLDQQGTTTRVLARLVPLMRQAKAAGAFINVDMEQYSYKDLTIAIFKQACLVPEFRQWPDVGIAIQAYLLECQEDLRSLCAWAEQRGTPVWIRLVKGAYWDYEQTIAAQRDWPVPVFSDKSATDANFEQCTRYLFAHAQWLRPAIAGHNVRSIAHALACAEQYQVAAKDFEFQMLFGMVDALKWAVTSMGYRVRVYAPFGALLPGIAYLVRRLLENTSNTSFVRAGFLDGVAPEDLLMDPQSVPPSAPSSSTGSELPDERAFRNEPLWDFSRATMREQLAAALTSVRARLPIAIHPTINGHKQSSTSAWTWANPSRTVEIIAQGSFTTADQVTQAITVAAQAAPAWGQRPVSERADKVRALATVLSEQRAELIALIMLEVGKSAREADGDVAEAIDFCRYYASQAEALQGPHRRDVPGELNEVIYGAKGVAAIIAPWNFPLAILTGMAVGNLVVGNPVVLKPAEQACAIAQALYAAMIIAGIPAAVCQLIPGYGDIIGPVLQADPRVAVIAFTGSRAVGLQLARTALDQAEAKGVVTKVVAEMGGKNAIIVDEDADLDEAVIGICASAFGFQGQKCSACSRLIVVEAVHDRLVERLAAAVRSFTIGPAEDPSVIMGPVIDDEAVMRVQRAIAQVQAPARVVAQGPVAAGGRYVPAVLIAGVSAHDRLAQDELFAPILVVIRVPTIEAAIQAANATPYALTGGCFTRNPQTIASVRQRLRVGNLYINRPITGAQVDRQPFGGFGLSGLGAKAGGESYLLQFVDACTVTENTLRHGFSVNRSGSVQE